MIVSTLKPQLIAQAPYHIKILLMDFSQVQEMISIGINQMIWMCVSEFSYLYKYQVKEKKMQKNNNILQLFNSYTFNSATQTVLSLLQPQELQNLLYAIQAQEKYQQLAIMIRSRILITLTEKVDRTFYYTHYDQIDLVLMKEERANKIASLCNEGYLKNILQNYCELTKKGNTMFGDEFYEIQNAVFEPSLQLPPMVRQTSAPECKTIYQITMACKQLGNLMEEQTIFTPNQQNIQFFFQCLKVHIDLSNTYLSSLIQDFQHFAELTYRFMVYRNVVMSLHQLCPFPVLSETMKLWSSEMSHHYQRSNKVFVQLIGLGAQRQSMAFGLLSGQELKEEGYMVDYVEGLVDQSISEDSVAFCGHSKQTLGGMYGKLEKELFISINEYNSSFPREMTALQLKSTLEDWFECGLRQSTIRKVCEMVGNLRNCSMQFQSMSCASDAYIENCARINGRGDINGIYISCSF